MQVKAKPTDPSGIQEAVRSGQASNLWKTGDLFPIAMSGTVGALAISGVYYACVLGFDHNKDLEGSNTMHLALPHDSTGKGLAFVDGYYGNFTNADSPAFVMNHHYNTKYPAGSNQYNYGFSEGGWEASYARVAVMPQFYNAMPSAWKTVIKAATKYRDNIAGGTNVADNVTSTVDNMWYLTEWEVFGARHYANTAEQSYQKQYDFYKNGGSKIRYKHNEAANAAHWWLASVYSGSATSFCGVYTSGGYSHYSAAYSQGAVPCFAIG